jgi:methionyl-tRNA formyltransferase
MRIVFIGAVEFSFKALRHLISLEAQIVGVCTLKASEFNADHVDLRPLSEAHAIPSFYVEDINSNETLDWIRDKSPDIIFCFGWSRLIKQDLLLLSPLGIVGFHPAALPANRGRHPIIWALVLGVESTASTFFFMNNGADSGDILSQEEIIIGNHDDARTLYDKVVQTAMVQITKFLPQLAKGTFPRIKQNESLANVWRKRGYADGQIDWRMSAQSIHNLVRGLGLPYAGAHFLLDGKEIKVWKTAVILDAKKNYEPGKVIPCTIGSVVIKCGIDAIELLDTEPKLQGNIEGYL